MLDRLKAMIVGREGEQNQEAQYVNDRRAALLLHSPRGARVLLYMVLIFVFTSLIWASLATIDETVKGKGKVIPSMHVQEIQHLEGGILQEIHVREGQEVKKGQLLMVVSDVQFASSIAERQAEYYGMLAKRKRLKAEAEGREPIFPEELTEKYSTLVDDEMRQYRSNQERLENDVSIFEARKQQRAEEKVILEKQLGHAKIREKISADKLARMQRLVERGSVSEMDVIQSTEELDDWVSKRETLTEEVRKAAASISELELSINKVHSDFRSQAGEEHNQVKVKTLGLEASLTGLADKEDRTRIKSPVKGIVNKIYLTTLGSVVRSGATLLEVVPLDDKLVIETKIKPKDIGFLRSGMKSKVKITAYAFATYGGLVGELTTISADTITSQKGETFFVVRVEIERTSLGTAEHPLPIIPGMQVEVDIIVDRKTVLSYLLKPMLKAREDYVTPEKWQVQRIADAGR